ncbi:DUF3106 domain-containing protein [Undibacterium cyanobacteriorum]|uniref:DUF3106 domain-containing protein n=1 Tax=Undibacterium cyanobacteriorum TaxID=3073561 RepID=A0ABY9RCT9_9BURK|nr:DUF3106 domain-containing protein [Undibacterium sp. 20NA77.5]WMW79058.1 DUF3106 domain-containing protein [Undibacterium sp. 20NA77.5]
MSKYGQPSKRSKFSGFRFLNIKVAVVIIAALLGLAHLQAYAGSSSTVANSTQIKWTNLTVEQKTALSALSAEWDNMDGLRQKKWLGIADKYSTMKPEEQKRVQERVAAWVKLSPEQRMLARENFTNTAKKSPEQKSAQWQQYQQLSDAEKQKLASEAKTKKSVTTIQPESKRTGIVLEPLKKVPPTKLDASATSQPTTNK